MQLSSMIRLPFRVSVWMDPLLSGVKAVEAAERDSLEMGSVIKRLLFAFFLYALVLGGFGLPRQHVQHQKEDTTTHQPPRCVAHIFLYCSSALHVPSNPSSLEAY